MTHEEIKLIAQFASLLTVICSLIYFALQIKQNTKMVQLTAERLAMTHEHTGATLGAQTYITLANDGTLAVLVHAGRKNYDNLEKEDKLRFNNYMLACFTIWQTGYHMHIMEVSNSKIWRDHEHAMKKILASAGVRTWFDRFEGMFSPDFRAFIRQLMASVSVPEQHIASQETE
jgi:hypothetical protein